MREIKLVYSFTCLGIERDADVEGQFSAKGINLAFLGLSGRELFLWSPGGRPSVGEIPAACSTESSWA